MCKIGVDDMVAINNKINKIINSSSKVTTKTEAAEILRNCGIFTKENKVASAYKHIIVKSGAYTNEKR